LYYTASGIVTPCRWPYGAQVSTCAPEATYGVCRCCIIQFGLLIMSTTVLETCAGM